MKRRVALVYGGRSTERDISLVTGKEISKAIPKTMSCTHFDLPDQLPAFINALEKGTIDVVLNALHGRDGEDGAIQGLCQWFNVPVTGSGIAGSAVAMDKSLAKAVLRDAGMPLLNDIRITSRAWRDDQSACLGQVRKLGKSLVVKPCSAGSSDGVSVKPANLEKAIRYALEVDGEACLVEPFVAGRELTVGVLEKKSEAPVALPVVEIRPKGAYFDRTSKYTTGGSEDLCPAPLTKKETRQAQDIAVRCHEALRCRGYSRTDMILTKKGIIVLETNTLPGMTPQSLFPLAARVAGYNLSVIIGMLVEEAYGRTQSRK